MKIDQRIDELFAKYLDNTLTPSEWEELLVWMDGIREQDMTVLTSPLSKLWEQARREELPSTAHMLDKEKMYNTVVSARPLVRRLWIRWSAAAALTGILLITTVLYFSHRRQQPAPVVQTIVSPEQVKPGSDKAILTLADGRRIQLDSTRTGILALQGAVAVANANGKLTYEENATGRSAAVVYNTVSTARANQYHLLLSDGSEVWLNAISSLRFPTSFTGHDRTVEMTGEAYFEIKKDPSRPFHVKVNGSDIEVLGTQFNVNAYPDEATQKTSLVEGAVKVTAADRTGMLTPGEEAIIPSGGKLTVAAGNVALAAAWKNGYFQFDRAALPAVLRQIGRWYDLDIQYIGPIPDRLFKGKLQRSLPLDRILLLLQKEDIHFVVEGKVLKVLR